jgi:hypothetical protein
MKSEPHKLTSKINKPLDKHLIRTDDPLPKTTLGLIYIISGRKGSGKTSLAINLLSNKKEGGYKKFFANIWLISPTARTDTKMKKLVNELDEQGKFYDEFNDIVIDEIRENVKAYNEENKDDDPRNLLILDDCMCDLPPRQARSILNKVVILARHMRLSIWLLVQKYNTVNTIIRSNADLISFFKTDNEKEYKKDLRRRYFY